MDVRGLVVVPGGAAFAWVELQWTSAGGQSDSINPADGMGYQQACRAPGCGAGVWQRPAPTLAGLPGLRFALLPMGGARVLARAPRRFGFSLAQPGS